MAGGQGSSGNIIAALASFFAPGLGQLLQGRVLAFLFFLVLADTGSTRSIGLADTGSTGFIALS